MISRDQPTCFPKNVTVKVSSKSDGSVLDRAAGAHGPGFIERRVDICKLAGTSYDETVFQRIIYAADRTYADIVTVDQHSTTKIVSEVAADALYTVTNNVALLLPVGDCAATVIYDPKRHALAMVHLGRHSTYSKLATQIVQHFTNDGSNTNDLIVWMGPHAQRESYKLAWFDQASDPDWKGYFTQTPDGFYLDMAGFNSQLMERAGVQREHIFISPVDTMKNDNYFSHALGDTAGRIAVVAILRP